MARRRSVSQPTLVPVDTHALAAQSEREMDAEIQAYEAASREHDDSAVRLFNSSANAFARGTSAALAVLGAAMAPLALLSLGRSDIDTTLTVVLICTLIASGLLLTDRASRNLIGVGPVAVRRAAALTVLSVGATALLLSSQVPGHPPIDQSGIAIDLLTTAGLLLLPGFMVDEVTRHRAMNHHAKARTAELGADYLNSERDALRQANSRTQT